MVHRDVAARNILLGPIDINQGITSNTTIKVSDFGMTRALDNEDIEKNASGKTKSKIGPLKWMAPESITKHEYSEKSDIYMFSICMWEILYAAEPYPDLDTLTAAGKALRKKERPKFNEFNDKQKFLCDFNIYIPEILQNLMCECWNHDKTQRPDFKIIYPQIQNIYDLIKKQVMFGDYNTHNVSGKTIETTENER